MIFYNKIIKWKINKLYIIYCGGQWEIFDSKSSSRCQLHLVIFCLKCKLLDNNFFYIQLFYECNIILALLIMWYWLNIIYGQNPCFCLRERETEDFVSAFYIESNTFVCKLVPVKCVCVDAAVERCWSNWAAHIMMDEGRVRLDEAGHRL